MKSWMITALAALSACTSNTTVAWTIEAEDPAILSEAVVVEASVRRGGCEGVLVYSETLESNSPGASPSLGRGLHGFVAEARDAQCNVLARGCVEYDLPLPTGDRVDVVLEGVDLASACSGVSCTGGRCAADVLPGSDAQVAQTPDAGTAPVCMDQTFNGHCYAVRAAALSWTAAESDCSAWGGHLVSIAGQAERDFVDGLEAGAFWIGLRSRNNRGYTWSDGSSSSFRPWAPGQPGNDRNARCVGAASDGWSLGSCDARLPYVCER
jgi:Lectin C-type domain